MLAIKHLGKTRQQIQYAESSDLQLNISSHQQEGACWSSDIM